MMRITSSSASYDRVCATSKDRILNPTYCDPPLLTLRIAILNRNCSRIVKHKHSGLKADSMLKLVGTEGQANLTRMYVQYSTYDGVAARESSQYHK